ncbi:MAG: DmsE family decaheme c-type cytochrome [Terracidiphilus sp.]
MQSAIPSKRVGLRACGLLMLGVLWLASQAIAAPGAKSATGHDKQQPAASEYVGSETCATCHQDVAKGFAGNPHVKMALMHGSNGVTCENCHGAGKAHVDGGGDVTKIFDPAKAPVVQINAKCETCHAGTHPNFDRSPHAKAGLSCISCHDVHKGQAETALLKAPQPTLCYQCHADQKAQFNMPIHHKVNEGVVKCTDCHDVHGTFQANNLRSTVDQNMICTKCHTDVRGPFVYEHAPVKAEGCLACHTPHGSQNARLLNMPNINVLCNQCHSPVAAATVHSMNAGSSELAPCTSCHTYIHGSNMNAAFLR